MYKLAFLINPFSGGGVGRQVFARLEEILDSFGIQRESWTAEMTEAGRLEEQADSLAERHPHIGTHAAAE